MNLAFVLYLRKNSSVRDHAVVEFRPLRIRQLGQILRLRAPGRRRAGSRRAAATCPRPDRSECRGGSSGLSRVLKCAPARQRIAQQRPAIRLGLRSRRDLHRHRQLEAASDRVRPEEAGERLRDAPLD